MAGEGDDREIIRPHDGWFGDPAVPVRVGARPVPERKRPAYGINPMSGWLFLIAAGLFAAATGMGIVTGSPFVHAVAFWLAILIGHFAVSYFMWVDPLPRSRFVLIPLGVVTLFGLVLLSFVLPTYAPVWLGWALVVAGLLGVAAGVVPLTAAWVVPHERPEERPAEPRQMKV